MEDIYKTLLNAVVAFLVLYIISKIMGKKQIAQLEFVDYVIGISIGSIAAEMTFDNTRPMYVFVLAMLVFAVLEIIITLLSRKAVFLKQLFNGSPLILVEEGKINFGNLKKSKLDVNELLALCRTKDYFDLNDIAYCILEINGQLSILPKGFAAPIVSQDIKTEFEMPSLSCDVIIDGKIIVEALKQINKTTDWLLEKINITNKKDIKDIALAQYDEAKDKITLHYKNK